MKSVKENSSFPERQDEVRPGSEQIDSSALGTEITLRPPKARGVELSDGAAPL